MGSDHLVEYIELAPGVWGFEQGGHAWVVKSRDKRVLYHQRRCHGCGMLYHDWAVQDAEASKLQVVMLQHVSGELERIRLDQDDPGVRQQLERLEACVEEVIRGTRP